MSTNAVEILRYSDLPPWTDERLAENFTVHDFVAAKDKDALLKELAPRVRGIATMGMVGCPGDVIRALPKLEIVACFAVGVDAVDTDAAREKGVIVTNTPDVLNDCVADLAMGLALDVLRQVSASDRFVRAGRWTSPAAFPLTRSLKGKTMGILGLGRIGMDTAKRARSFGMKIAYHNRNRRSDVDFDYHDSPAALAEASDVMVVLCPATAATRNIVDAKVLDALGPEGYLVSISRGACVDEPALVDALVNRRIGGAGIDVFVDEPNVPEPLKRLDNVVLTPHMGSGTIETRTAMGNLMIDNLIAHFSGKKVLTPVA